MKRKRLETACWRYGEIAAQLVRQGYKPIPLYPASKQPAVTGWPDYRFDKSALDNRSCPRRVGSKLVFPNFATGIVTGEVIGLDIDVRGARMVRKLKALADRMLGPGPDRVGAPPKFLRVFRTETPFKKQRSRCFALPGDKTRAKGYKPHVIEVLAKGFQFVAEAIHEKTGLSYQWSIPGGLLVTPVSNLTTVTEAQCHEYIAAAEAILLESGAKVRSPKSSHRKGRRPAPKLPNVPQSLRRELAKDADAQCAAVSASRGNAVHDPAACRAALAAIPNRDEDYDLWWRVGLACAVALGEPGRRDFIAWSRKSKKYDGQYTDRAYTSFLKYAAEGKSQITAGSIIYLAKQAGWKWKRRRKASRRPPYWLQAPENAGSQA
jgi:hypothetical protein